MNSFDDYDDIVIHWVAGVPITNLRPVVNNILPPGDWFPYNRFRQVSDSAVERLCRLRGESMPGTVFAVINRSLDQIALVEKPSAQQSFNLSLPPTDGTENSADTEMSKETLNAVMSTSVEDIKNASVGISIDLLKRYDNGDQISAEMFFQALGQSPDRQLTAGALKDTLNNPTSFAA